MKDEFEISDLIEGSVENEIMTGLEVTLYSEWNKLNF